MEMTREDGTLTTEVGKDMGKEGPAKKKNAILDTRAPAQCVAVRDFGFWRM